jgi:hypothetical protein
MRFGTAVAVLGLIVPSTAGATPFLGASAGSSNQVGGCTGGGTSTSTGAPVSSQIVCADVNGAGSALAIAVIGNLGSESRAQEFGASTAGFGSEVIYSDSVVFSGPGDELVPVAINLHFGGSINSSSLLEAGASARARAFIDGSLAGEIFVSTSGLCTITFAGLSSCAPVYDVTLRSSQILVRQDTPILLQLNLDTGASAAGFNQSGTSLFSNTFSFITGGPLFVLPDDFTANSPTSFIVNNRFVSPDAPGPAVPEPASLAMSGVGIAALAGLRALRLAKAKA